MATRPPFEGSHFCATSDELLSAAELPKRIAIIGAGYIGVSGRLALGTAWTSMSIFMGQFV